MEIRGTLGWEVLDFDYDTETVLGLCTNGDTRIFYFAQIERTP